MFFTQEDYKNIQKWLSLNAVKDTEFREAEIPLKGNETIAFVQNGRNVQWTVDKFLNNLIFQGIADFINLTTKYKLAPTTLDKAISNIEYNNRNLGQVVCFLSEYNNWEFFQYFGKDVQDFNDVRLWKSLLPLHFQGLFNGKESLISTLPTPRKGNYAYVREENPARYYLYQCNEDGKWENTGDLLSLVADLHLDGDLSISEHNTWVIKGVDTGIDIYPKNIYWEQITDRPITWEDLNNLMEGEPIFSPINHKHSLEQIPGLKEYLENLDTELENFALKDHNHDDRYAKYDIDTAVRNITDADGNSLFNKDGIVIFRGNGSDGQGNQVFTDRGVIEKILRIDGNEFTVKLRQRWEGDFTSFQKDDIIRGVVSSPTISGEYYTAWARIVDINRYANEIKLVHYNNSEVPENTNYDITKNMIIHRFGNATDTERQSIWYISSTEGRIVFLTGVTKPILEDYNYASFWGNPLPLKVFEDKPINMNQPYAYMRGLLVQDLIRVDYNGVPIKDIVNSGPWIKGKVYNDGSKSPYIQHEVYHNGVLWRCIIDNSTEEPTFDSSQWAVMSDNTRFSVELYTDAPLFYRPNTEFKYNLVAKVFHGTEDITDKMVEIDCRWERNTRNIIKDNAWNSLHSNSTNLVEITQEDVGIPENGVTIFKCEVYIKDGDNLYKINKQIEL